MFAQPHPENVALKVDQLMNLSHILGDTFYAQAQLYIIVLEHILHSN